MCTSCLVGWTKKQPPKPVTEPTDSGAKSQSESGSDEIFPMVGKKPSLRPPGNANPNLQVLGGSQNSQSATVVRRLSVQNVEKHISERPGSSASGNVTSTTQTTEPGRRNSQNNFADKGQTVIILDWDDTLFPSTYIRSDLSFSLRHSLEGQQISERLREEVRQNLAANAATVEQVLRLAVSCGKVIIVTLAKNPWVSNSCKFFYPGIGELIESLGIKIVYAQQGLAVEYNKLEMMRDEEIGAFWSGIKGQAIGKEIREFYSQYDGQSWKNILSIGDSDFERVGTMMSTEDYMKHHGISAKGGGPLGEAEIQGHVYRVRTKTFKMLDQPTVQELHVQLDLLHKWVPLMVALDDGFDVEFSSLDDTVQLKHIEAVLQGKAGKK